MTDLVRKARSLATRLHSFQRYGDFLPYDYHLENVVSTLMFFGIKDDNMIAAGWLHDVIEDTYLSYSKLVREFNKEIADLVFAVSNELGKNRKERNLKTYPKMKGFERATQLKLADRIANIKHSYFSNLKHEKFDMYRAEHKEFEAGVRDKENESTITSKMWDHLEDMFERGIPD